MKLFPSGGLKGWLKALGRVVLIIGIFVFGVAVGQGRIDFNRTSTSNSHLPNRLDYTSTNQVYQALKANFDGKLTQEQLENGLKHGLAESTKDPYTVFFTANEAKEFNDELNNSFSGIGAQLGLDKDGNLEVIAPIDGLPADKAGLKAKDLIVTINGESTSGMSIDDAVGKIRGPEGTTVKLEVVRDRTQPLSFKIVREDINLPSVKTKMLEGNIGYIQITSFADDTLDLTRKAANDFKSKGVSSIILDLRSNPGGLLESSTEISSLWLSKGDKILDEKAGGKVVDSISATSDGILKGTKTVVLIDGGSASASEITAGALRDNNAAYLIGEKSYGKGVVQQLFNFRDGSQLKVTVASWYRPNGQNINKKGIKPDQTVKISDADAEAKKDTQLLAAQDYLAPKQ